MAVETIRITDANVHFPVRSGLFGQNKRIVHAVDGVNLTLNENETVALVGESGSGKTTLGQAVVGLQKLSSGRIDWRGKDVDALSGESMRGFHRDVQVVFQDPYGSLNPRQTIGQALRRPLLLHKTVAPAEADAYVEDLLDRVGLSPSYLYTDNFPHEFSGGQRQRIAIARALALNPSVLVADEPVSALDVSIRTQILKLLQRLKSELKLSLLFLSHDLGVVRFIADRVVVMYLGKLVETGPVDAIFDHPHHPYTQVLLGAAPSLSRARAHNRERVTIVGEPPKPTAPPSGCRFRTRCPFAMDICKVEPVLKDLGGGHSSACHLDGPALAP
ncbi:MAG TPA: oligopeptide/dipeptide ABC transporter ATP-binding protein [Devosiaceae bacterium]|jgi:oligopeptide/dipeptide ABC transporter ATP-binding protein